MLHRYKICSVYIDKVSYSNIVEKISDSLKNNSKIIINYVNAHVVRLADHNKLLDLALSRTDINYPDGAGIYFASRLLYPDQNICRFNWTDHANRFLDEAIKQNWKLYFLGSTKKIIQQAVTKLKKSHPGLQIVGYTDGYEGVLERDICTLINNSKADILWVGMGTPKQEIWINRNQDKLECNAIQSVGDIFSLFTGRKPRGPVYLRKLGLEWLSRLVANPIKYSNRYLVGIPIFIYMIIREFYIKKRNG